MATEVIKVIDPDMGSGYDYDSLFDWEAAQQGDLTGARDEIAVAKCRCTGGTADTTGVDINGWTTSATQYIKIWTDPAESYRHSGTWPTGNKYSLQVSSVRIIDTNELFINLDGLALSTTYNGSQCIPNPVVGGIVNVSNCIIKCGGGSDTSYGIYAYWGGTINVYNSIIYDVGTNVISAAVRAAAGYAATNVANIYSCTLITSSNPCAIWCSGSGTVVVAKNCYGYGATAYVYYVGGGGSLTLTKCASSDHTGSDEALHAIALNTTNFTNVTAGSENFHLPAGSALIDVGTDTSGDSAPLNFTTDIDGQTRTGSWDIGADEYVAAGGFVPYPLSSRARGGLLVLSGGLQ